MNISARPVFAFSVNWKITVASLIFFPILISLGTWQLQRAGEKQTILDLWYEQQAMAPIKLENLIGAKNLQMPIAVKVKFDTEKYWLLENRFYESKLGYEVLMLSTLESGEKIIVNRGWVAASPYREQLPEISTPSGNLEIQGVLKEPTDFSMLKESGSSENAWPKRIIEVNIEKMAADYGAPIFEKILGLEANSLAALKVGARLPINMTPAKHRAYAFQWFALAVALIVLWLVANTNIVKVLSKS